MNTLSSDDVIHLAKLAGLTITDQEISSIQQKLSDTVTYIEVLKELDTTNVSDKVHMSFTENVTFSEDGENKRLLTHEEALSNAKKATRGMFQVEKLMD